MVHDWDQDFWGDHGGGGGGGHGGHGGGGGEVMVVGWLVVEVVQIVHLKWFKLSI